MTTRRAGSRIVAAALLIVLGPAGVISIDRGAGGATDCQAHQHEAPSSHAHDREHDHDQPAGHAMVGGGQGESDCPHCPQQQCGALGPCASASSLAAFDASAVWHGASPGFVRHASLRDRGSSTVDRIPTPPPKTHS